MVMEAGELNDLLERMIPLPKRVSLTGIRATTNEAVIVGEVLASPIIARAADVLLSALPGARIGRRGLYEIRLVTAPDDVELVALPNADQAYRIGPLPGSDLGIALTGVTDVGVLYAALTLAQLVRTVRTERGVVAAEIPLGVIVDWPDLAERGQWGGDAAWDIGLTAPLKMNLIEVGVLPKLDDKGKLSLQLTTPPICADALRQGVKALPYVPHLGDLGKYSNLFELRPGLMSTPNPDEPLPPDYKPSLCFSKPAAAELLAQMMTASIHTFGVCGKELNIWLTEEGVPCFCDGCRGQNTYVLETRLIASAYRMVKRDHPDFRLRILLTQGSYPVNDQVLAAVPADMGVTYYSGTHTYDSSHQPMIYPLLATHAAKGGWLGVYPQVDNSWRTVFPFTGPQFMRNRMREFASKKLQSVTGYATPSNKFWRFNVAALAEWGWNAKGRDERQFARAWARRQGIADAEGYAEWAVQIGPLGWDLAGSRFPMRLFWDPARTILEKPTAMTYGDGLLAEIPSAAHLDANIAAAEKALAMATTLGMRECVAESQVVLNSYVFLKALIAISQTPRTPATVQEQGKHLAVLGEAAAATVRALWEWGCEVYPLTPTKPQHRFEETMSVFAQVVTEAYRRAAEAGVADPHPAWSDRTVGAWTEKDFRAGEARLTFDVTRLLDGAGAYRVMFRYLGGGYGADILLAEVWQGQGKGARRVARIEPKSWGYGDKPPAPHIGRYEAWNDVRLDVDAVELGQSYYLRVKLGGLPRRGVVAEERRTTRGEVCLRRAWA
jgi:hypothetical protein